MTLALAAFLVLWAGKHRPYSRVSGVLPKVLWIQKVEYGPEFDIVFAGASRTLEGIAPEEVRKVLPGRRVANFGFGHTGHDARYLAAARGLLAPDARDPTIVLAIHPVGLSVHASMTEYSDFHKWTDTPPWKRWVEATLAPVHHFLRPLGTKKLRAAWKGKREQGHRIYTESGWVNAAPLPEDPRNFLEIYPTLLHHNPLSEPMMQAVLDAVRRWRAEGIRVFGYRPPIVPDLARMEVEWTGFDYPAYIRAFREAGGTWLEFDHSKYGSYDGSHLREESARRFSQEIARRIAP